ncbi:hypothetical protein CBF45_08405 [Bordetella sp. J329]|nr:hypothetical protein CBF45_08405 [Bordetella sp. J329]
MVSVILQGCGVSDPENNDLALAVSQYDGWHSVFEPRDIYDYEGVARSYTLAFDEEDATRPVEFSKAGSGKTEGVREYAGVPGVAYSLCGSSTRSNSSVARQNAILAYGQPVALADLPADFELPDRLLVNCDDSAALSLEDDSYASRRISSQNGVVQFGSYTLDVDGRYSGSYGYQDANLAKGIVQFYRHPENGQLVAVVSSYYRGYGEKYGRSVYFNPSSGQAVSGISNRYTSGYQSWNAQLQRTMLDYHPVLDDARQPLGFLLENAVEPLSVVNNLRVGSDATYAQGIANTAYVACSQPANSLVNDPGQPALADNQVFYLRQAEALPPQAAAVADADLPRAMDGCRPGNERAVSVRVRNQRTEAVIGQHSYAVAADGGFGDAGLSGTLRLFKNRHGNLLALYRYRDSTGSHVGLRTNAPGDIVATDFTQTAHWHSIEADGSSKPYAAARRFNKLAWFRPQDETGLMRKVTRSVAYKDVAFAVCDLDTMGDWPLEMDALLDANTTFLLHDSLRKLDAAGRLGRTTKNVTHVLNSCNKVIAKLDLTFEVSDGAVYAILSGSGSQLKSPIDESGNFNRNGLSGHADFYLDEDNSLVIAYAFQLNSSSGVKAGRGVALESAPAVHGQQNAVWQSADGPWLRIFNVRNNWTAVAHSAAGAPIKTRGGWPTRINRYHYMPRDVVAWQGLAGRTYFMCEDYLYVDGTYLNDNGDFHLGYSLESVAVAQRNVPHIIVRGLIVTGEVRYFRFTDLKFNDFKLDRPVLHSCRRSDESDSASGVQSYGYENGAFYVENAQGARVEAGRAFEFGQGWGSGGAGDIALFLTDTNEPLMAYRHYPDKNDAEVGPVTYGVLVGVNSLDAPVTSSD